MNKVIGKIRCGIRSICFMTHPLLLCRAKIGCRVHSLTTTDWSLTFFFLFLFRMQSGNQKGSFLSRESGTLEKLAEMTRGKSEAKTGSTAKNTNNFVFAAVSPPPKSGNYKNNEQAADITGQLISKCIFVVIILTKKTTMKLFSGFLPQPLKGGQIKQKIKKLYCTNQGLLKKLI